MTLNRRAFVAGALGGALPLFTTHALAKEGHRHEVSIRNFVFEPDILEVKVGDRIKFTNHDLAPHTATADDGSWDTETLDQGQSIELTVTASWSGSYFCAYHPAMTATLTIK